MTTETSPTFAFKILQPCCAHPISGSLLHQCHRTLHSVYHGVYKPYKDNRLTGIMLGITGIWTTYFPKAAKKGCLFQNIHKVSEKHQERYSWGLGEGENWNTVCKPYSFHELIYAQINWGSCCLCQRGSTLNQHSTSFKAPVQQHSLAFQESNYCSPIAYVVAEDKPWLYRPGFTVMLYYAI